MSEEYRNDINTLGNDSEKNRETGVEKTEAQGAAGEVSNTEGTVNTEKRRLQKILIMRTLIKEKLRAEKRVKVGIQKSRITGGHTVLISLLRFLQSRKSQNRKSQWEQRRNSVLLWQRQRYSALWQEQLFRL